MIESEMVERLARAMENSARAARSLVEYLHLARVALTAARTPTEAMLRVGEAEDDPADVWRAMIDAALMVPSSETGA